MQYMFPNNSDTTVVVPRNKQLRFHFQVVRMDIERFAVSKELGTNQKSLGQEQSLHCNVVEPEVLPTRDYSSSRNYVQRGNPNPDVFHHLPKNGKVLNAVRVI